MVSFCKMQRTMHYFYQQDILPVFHCRTLCLNETKELLPNTAEYEGLVAQGRGRLN